MSLQQQSIDQFVISAKEAKDGLAEAIGRRAGGGRIVALSVAPGAQSSKGERGLLVVLVTEDVS
jgi:hypothetical protein